MFKNGGQLLCQQGEGSKKQKYKSRQADELFHKMEGFETETNLYETIPLPAYCLLSQRGLCAGEAER
jgi:hypothetical protein